MDCEYFEKEKNFFSYKFLNIVCSCLIYKFLSLKDPDLHPLNITSGYTNSATPLYPKETPSKIVMGV